jgi:hypothetical protein
MIQSYLSRLTRSELLAVMTGGFASVASSTLVGHALLGAPLNYLLAATVMNAPASLYMLDGEPGQRVDRERRRGVGQRPSRRPRSPLRRSIAATFSIRSRRSTPSAEREAGATRARWKRRTPRSSASGTSA